MYPTNVIMMSIFYAVYLYTIGLFSHMKIAVDGVLKKHNQQEYLDVRCKLNLITILKLYHVEIQKV